MDCKKFHLWLQNRDTFERELPTDVMAHRQNCRDCDQLYDLDSGLEQEITAAFAQQEVPQGLEERISLGLDHEGSQPFFKPKKSLKYAGLAASLAILMVIVSMVFTSPVPSYKNLEQISEQAVKDHLKGNWKISFDTSTLYQALEMLTRELGFNVRLPDLSDQGCLLVGGRLCALGKCRAAYFILEQQGKKGSLFIMDTSHLAFDMADGTRFSTTLKGCNAQVWKDNGQVYAMVF